jgi:alkanesulfonate monooxygenase SsuD/methylene tetrahydromethanopterin reductase-like flavin-dependent oxidoreductase (luciferase family)
VALARSAWVAETTSEVEQKWWPAVKAFHQPYIKLGLFKDISDDAGANGWSFDQVSQDRLVAGNPDRIVKEIERYRAEIGCEWMILLLRHPLGPSHEEVLRSIELFGKEVLPHFKG